MNEYYYTKNHNRNMEKLKGTVKTVGYLPVAPVLATAPAVPEIKTQSLVDILVSVKKEDGEPLVSYNQSLALTSLKFSRGDTILTLEDRPFVYEVVNMLNDLEYELVYNFLNAGWEKIFGSGAGLRKKILFENPLLNAAREKMDMDMEIFRNKIDVAKGSVNCKRCGSEETLSVERQIRSADEASTVTVFCVQCKYKWRAQ